MFSLLAAWLLPACQEEGEPKDAVQVPNPVMMPSAAAVTAAGTGAGMAGQSPVTAGAGAMAGAGGVAAGTAPPLPNIPIDAGTGAMNDAATNTGDSGQTPNPLEPTTGAFPPVTDFEMAGPYRATTLQNVGPDGYYTVYYPQELAPDGAKNPIVGWMSGGGTTHTLYPLLPHLASHGFVVVAANSVPGIGAEAQLGQEIIAGIDWMLTENARADSAFFDKLDESKLASAGYSMGSLATFMIADDPRLTTTVHISGGNMAQERVNNLHAPAAFICGQTGNASCNILSPDCDIAAINCDADFANATTPVFYANFNAGHLGILTPPFTELISEMTTAWLRNKLMGDTTLDARFVGDDCAYCSDSDWTVQQKNL